MGDKLHHEYYTGPQAGDFAKASEPFALFAAWFEEAKAHEPNDPNAMALASVDAAGMPNVRMTLLKGVDAEGAGITGIGGKERGVAPPVACAAAAASVGGIKPPDTPDSGAAVPPVGGSSVPGTLPTRSIRA